MDKITYDGNEIDFDSLPAASQVALVTRGVTHFLGNEQASKVSGWAKKIVEDGGEEPADDEKKAKKAEFVAAALEALRAGTVGSRTSAGPRATPFESALRAIAKEEVVNLLRQNKIKVPTKDSTISFKGEDLTMEQLIARRIANPNHAERLKKEAAAKVRESEKRIKALADAELDL